MTKSVDAHEKAATPPGTMPWCAQGCPPVPGHPLAKWREPMTKITNPPLHSDSGRSKGRTPSRTRSLASAHTIGTTHTAKAGITAATARLITSMADVVTALSGSDHCHPMVT